MYGYVRTVRSGPMLSRKKVEKKKIIPFKARRKLVEYSLNDLIYNSNNNKKKKKVFFEKRWPESILDFFNYNKKQFISGEVGNLYSIKQNVEYRLIIKRYNKHNTKW